MEEESVEIFVTNAAELEGADLRDRDHFMEAAWENGGLVHSFEERAFVIFEVARNLKMVDIPTHDLLYRQ